MAQPSQLALEIVTPDRAVVHEQVDEVQAPGAMGYFGVLWYRKGAEKSYLSVAGGVAEVTADRVIVLAQIAERAEEINVDRAQAAKQRAEQRLASHQRDMDLERARVALMKAMTRLNVASRARTRG
jgi:F-type H+-transporting ATPase subunit epsilon